MAYQALARKYRPQSFRDILGQDSVVRTLQNSIEQGRIHQVYLFSGVRGVGKTTSARILAKALNCEKGPAAEPCNHCTICHEITEGIDLDVREIDAATYSKAEDVREIREVVQFQPARDRYRIFIIDEVHSLSGQAWNALLKQIEEPPPHVVFMMATTEIQKVPPTILSRVQQLSLRKITASDVADRIREICEREKISIEPEAVDLIARRGEGSVRDSLSLLDQVIAFSGDSVTAPDVAAIAGLSDARFFARIVEKIRDGNAAAILELIDEAGEMGRDFKLLYRDLLSYVRGMLIVAAGADESLILLEPEDRATLRELAASFEYSELLRILNLLIRDDEIVTRSEQQRLAVEVVLLKAAVFPRLKSVEQLLAGGGVAQTAAVPTARAASAAPWQPEAHPSPRAASGDDLPAQLVSKVRTDRKLLASYLEQAKSIRLDGDTLVIVFDAANSFQADYIGGGDHLVHIGAAASGLAGRTVTARLESTSADQTPKETQRSLLSADPVIQSFQKHLGAEVIAKRSGKTEER